MEAGFILAATLLLALQLARALWGLTATGAWWVVPIALPLGVVAADAATGLVHWLCDRFFSESTPLVVDALIRPFREHHVDPEAIVSHGWLELHGNSAAPVSAVLVVAWWLQTDSPSATASAVDVFVLVFCAMSLATNQFHAWAHARSVPAPVGWLQRRHLILPPEVHAAHHRGAFDRSYCITCGLLNPLLDRFDFFGRLERGLRAYRPRAHR